MGAYSWHFRLDLYRLLRYLVMSKLYIFQSLFAATISVNVALILGRSLLHYYGY